MTPADKIMINFTEKLRSSSPLINKHSFVEFGVTAPFPVLFSLEISIEGYMTFDKVSAPELSIKDFPF